jgi:hypothetical protein
VLVKRLPRNCVDPDFATGESEDFTKVLTEKLQSVSQEFEEPAEKLDTTKSEKGELPETPTPVGKPEDGTTDIPIGVGKAPPSELLTQQLPKETLPRADWNLVQKEGLPIKDDAIDEQAHNDNERASLHTDDGGETKRSQHSQVDHFEEGVMVRTATNGDELSTVAAGERPIIVETTIEGNALSAAAWSRSASLVDAKIIIDSDAHPSDLFTRRLPRAKLRCLTPGKEEPPETEPPPEKRDATPTANGEPPETPPAAGELYVIVSKQKTTYQSSLGKRDQLVTDTTEFLDQEGTVAYQSMIGSLLCAVSLARLDIATWHVPKPMMFWQGDTMDLVGE